jgi:hydroxymethylbilane synthase
MKKLVIATRRSRLALWQAEHIAERLRKLRQGLQVELLPMSTRGDELIDRRLDQAGGKGLFVKELENAMADGRAHLAVHSMKDMPAELPPGFKLAAITAREDPRDAFVSSKFKTFKEMPKGATVGTSSLRRQSQVVERHPGLEVLLLRGNVETRLAKLDRGEYGAIVLATAGLARLGLEGRITARLEVDDMLPAPGQGALGGSCTLPLAAYAIRVQGDRLRLRALVASADGKRVVRQQFEGVAADPEALGNRVAEDLRRRGAAEILGL